MRATIDGENSPLSPIPSSSLIRLQDVAEMLAKRSCVNLRLYSTLYAMHVAEDVFVLGSD